jgi:hypothetical protein
MAEIITDFGEVRMSLKKYDNMQEEIRTLKEENDNLTTILDHVCEENKVRVRRQIIRETRLMTDPHALGTKEIIEDILINCDDLAQELYAKVHECEDGWMKKATDLQQQVDTAEKMLEECQRQKFNVEQELLLLKARGWWRRLWNK